MVNGAAPAASRGGDRRRCTVPLRYRERGRGGRGAAGSGAHHEHDGVVGVAGGGTAATRRCSTHGGRRGRRGRWRRCRRSPADSLRGEEQHGVAELGAATASAGAAGIDGERDDGGGGRTGARARVSGLRGERRKQGERGGDARQQAGAST